MDKNHITMVSNHVFFLATLCIFQSGFSYASFGLPDLDLALASTTEFFQRLKANYEPQPPTVELYRSIDKEIDEFVKKIKESAKGSRSKRQLDFDKEKATLDGFEDVPGLEIRDALDVSFFGHKVGPEVDWYAAVLDSRGIALFRYQQQQQQQQPHRTFVHIDTYELTSGTRVISHSCETATILVIQRSVGDVVVLRLSLSPRREGKPSSSAEIFHRAPTPNAPDARDSTLWRGMNNVYLAVASPRNITVFEWLGAHFDAFQTTDNIGGARRLVPFRTGGTMHLAAIDAARTLVLKFRLSSREFVVAQRLVGALDGSAFRLENDHHVGETFLALSSERSTLVYKETRHRFVPFQELPAAREIRSLTNMAATTAAAVLLLLPHDRDRTMLVYRYDGGKFVESAAIRDSGIVDAIPVSLQRGEQLVVLNRRFSDRSVMSFRRIAWRTRKSWSALRLRDETNIWCRDSMRTTATRAPPAVPKTAPTIVRMQRGHVQNLRVHSLNGETAEKFAAMTNRWKKIVTTTKERQEATKRCVSTVNPVLKNLRANDVRANCSTRCRAARTETTTSSALEAFESLRRLDDVDRNLKFRRVKLSFAENLGCPIPAPKFRRATVTGRVNGIRSFGAFARDVVKVTGDQTLNAAAAGGSYEFASLRVVDAKIPLDVAANRTRQSFEAKIVEAEELNVNAGGLLMPLNGGSSVFGGSLTVPKARVKGLVDIRGKITGPGGDRLAPTIHIAEPLEIVARGKNVSLRSVKIVETLEARDLVGVSSTGGKSLSEILANALPLESAHVPVHFQFHREKVSWTDMTIRNFPYKWVTKRHEGHTVITGTKHATMPTITFGKLAYGNLPTPRLPLRLCSVNVISEGIWDSNLEIDRGAARSVKSINVFEDFELSEFYRDAAAASFDEISWDLKKFVGRVTVNAANIASITGMDYQGLRNSMGRWVEPGRRLEGSLRVPGDFRVQSLMATRGLKVVLPLEVGNVISEQNMYVDKLNGKDFDSFLESVVKIEKSVSLRNVTFAGGFDATDISARETSFGLQENLASGNLGSKEILGTLESRAMIVPRVLAFVSKDVPVNIIANGHVKFVKEPKIANVNRKNLEQLYGNVWLTDRATVASAESMVFEDVRFESNLTISKLLFDTPNLGSWAGLETRLFSKSKAQHINASASFNSVQAPNVIGAAKSRLRSNASDLRDLEVNTLKNNGTQVVTTNWDFDELIVTGNFDVRGAVNGLNLARDIVRYDVDKNVISGKKIIGDLTARNIDGLEFGKFAKNALKRNNGNRTIVVKGWKSLKSIEARNIRVEGKVMGRRTENSLLKSSTQNLRGRKCFRGSFVAASAVETNGTINEVARLKTLVKYQLKKRAPRQIIESPILLANNVTILGNVTVGGLFHGVELRRNFDSGATAARSLESVVEESSKIMEFAEGIDVALANRAVYWEKLELLEENSTPLRPDPEKEEALLSLDGLGRCGIRDSSLYCNDEKILDALLAAPNRSRVLRAELLALSGMPHVAYVTSGSPLAPGSGVSIFRYVPRDKSFLRVADVRVPGIVEGSIAATKNSMWMILRLRDHAMILQYEPWAADIQRWTLPGGGPFLVSSAPTEQLLIFRSDGVWRLGGLAGPRRLFRATLNGQIDTFSFGSDYYVQLSDNNVTTLLKTRYVGN